MKKLRLPDGFAVASALILLLAAGLFAAFWPQPDFSDHERRYLADAPALPSLTHWETDDEVESYLSDRVPFRRALVAVDSASNLLTGRGTQLETWLVAGSFIEQPIKADEHVLARRLEQMDAAAAKAGAPWLVLTPPTHGNLLRAEMPALMRDLYDEEAQLYQALQSHPAAIPMNGVLSAPEAYYRTDHHWTLAGAHAAYQACCQALGFAPLALDQFALSSFDGFWGTTFSRSGMPFAKADTLHCAQPAGEIRLLLPEDGTEYPTLIFPDQAATYDGYAVYMNGNHGYAEILNPAAPEGTLLVFKDSFANCFLPLLSAHYSRIIAVDARYYARNFSDAIAQAGPVDQLLFLYSMDSLLNDTVVARKLAR